MINGANLQVDTLETAEGALTLGNAFVGRNHVFAPKSFAMNTGANYIDAIKRRLFPHSQADLVFSTRGVFWCVW